VEEYIRQKEIFKRTKKSGDAVLIANTENSFKDISKEKDSFTRFYGCMSQIVAFDVKNWKN